MYATNLSHMVYPLHTMKMLTGKGNRAYLFNLQHLMLLCTHISGSTTLTCLSINKWEEDPFIPHILLPSRKNQMVLFYQTNGFHYLVRKAVIYLVLKMLTPDRYQLIESKTHHQQHSSKVPQYMMNRISIACTFSGRSCEKTTAPIKRFLFSKAGN